MMFASTKTYSSILIKYFARPKQKNMMQMLDKCEFGNLTEQRILLHRLTEHTVKCMTVNGRDIEKERKMSWRWSVGCGWKRNKVDQSNIWTEFNNVLSIALLMYRSIRRKFFAHNDTTYILKWNSNVFIYPVILWLSPKVH